MKRRWNAVDASFEGTDIYVDPAAFCGVAARMLADGGRDAVPAVLTLLGQALSANVDLLQAGSTRAAIPRPRLRAAATDEADTSAGTAIDLPVRARGAVLAVLAIESDGALDPTWTGSPGPLGTIADLLALTLAAGADPDAVTDIRSAARTWFHLDELDRGELAGELHDGLVQSLVAARYLLDLAASAWPDGPQPWLDAIRESMQAALADGRGLMNSVQVRTRAGRGLRLALEELCAGSRVPVELLVADPAAPAAELSPVAAAAGYRFVQASLEDLIGRGAEAAEVKYASGQSGLSLDIAAVGDRPAWPDEPGEGIRRWATRIDLLGGSALLQSASAHLRFGPADGEAASTQSDVRAGRAK